MVGHAPLYKNNLRFLESKIRTRKWDEELKDPNDEVLRERSDD